MRKMTFIYGHWGKGIYWDVIEVLRDQDGYCFESDDISLQMLADIIGCKDPDKFQNWFKDCVKINLLQLDGKMFYSEVLNENMEIWEIKKTNGSKGGRPKKTETKPKRNQSHNLNETIIEQNSIEQNITKQNKENLIDIFFKDFPNSSDFESLLRRGYSREQLLTQLDIFRKHSELSYPTFQKFTSHFKNWLVKNPPKDPNTLKMVY